MNLPKVLAVVAVILFSSVAIFALFKGKKEEPVAESTPVEVEVEENLPKPTFIPKQKEPSSNSPKNETLDVPEKISEKMERPTPPSKEEPPQANRIEEFFNVKGPKIPIVETITYKSRVAWQQGRPAWLSDYAKHYQTSRHFIARSLHGKPDYFKQDLVEGARFNVLRNDKNFKFHLLVDLSRCKLWFFYDDLDTHERVLVKTYTIGLGRIDPSKASGLLTPTGQYSLGNKVAIYKPKAMGTHNGERIEMMTVFGTRWIPFDKEIKRTTSPAKGLGLHGLPWIKVDGQLVEDRSSLGKYQSDGCIRLASEDIEELYSIIISRPTTIELVKDYFDRETLQ